MGFSTDKKIPTVSFIADETKRATGLYGPEAILSDLTELAKMFDPTSTHEEETTGGIRECNFSTELEERFLELLEKAHVHEYDAEPFENSEGLVKSGKLFEFFKKYATLKHLENELKKYLTNQQADVIFDNFEQIIEEDLVKKEELNNTLQLYETVENVEIWCDATNELFEETWTKIDDVKNDVSELSQKSITHNSDKKISLHYGGGTLYNILVDGMYIYPELAERCRKAFCDVNGDNITETYATKKELENYVKKDDYSGINSMSYFYADNFNNGLFGKVATSGAVLCDYIFKNNSMADITVDLSNCYSMIGGFNKASVESVTFENGTPKLQKANNLFRGCTKMVSVTGLDLTNCDSVKYMFMDCESLAQNLTIKTKATDLSYMFYNCKKITSVTLDTPNLKIAKGIFTGCESLNKIIINTPLDYTALFNELPTVENKVIELVNQNLAVTAEVEKIATSKGWNIKYVSTVNKDFATIY